MAEPQIRQTWRGELLTQVNSDPRRREQIGWRRSAMSTFDILYFAGVVCTLVILAAIFAWDEYHAKHISH